MKILWSISQFSHFFETDFGVFLAGFLSRWRLRRYNKAYKSAMRMSEYLYQVREYQGELWLTFNDSLVCPCALLRGDITDVLVDIRSAYVTRRMIGGMSIFEKKEFVDNAESIIGDIDKLIQEEDKEE